MITHTELDLTTPKGVETLMASSRGDLCVCRYNGEKPCWNCV